MDTKQLKQDFEQILSDVMKINGLPIEQATDVAKAILQESGKYKRTEMMNQARQNGSYAVSGNGSSGNGNQPATEKQLAALKSFRVSFNEEGITKAEASKLLEPHMARVKARNG